MITEMGMEEEEEEEEEEEAVFIRGLKTNEDSPRRRSTGTRRVFFAYTYPVRLFST